MYPKCGLKAKGLYPALALALYAEWNEKVKKKKKEEKRAGVGGLDSTPGIGGLFVHV